MSDGNLIEIIQHGKKHVDNKEKWDEFLARMNINFPQDIGIILKNEDDRMDISITFSNRYDYNYVRGYAHGILDALFN